jgi:MGT family glycosyltransferase
MTDLLPHVRSVLLAAMPAEGHVRPVLVAAAELVRAGHRVRMLTGAAFQERVEALGADFLPLPPEVDAEALAAAPGGSLQADLRGIFVRPVRAQVAAIDAALAEERADVLVADAMLLGASAIAHRPRPTRPRVVLIGVMPLALTDPDLPPFGPGLLPARTPAGRLLHRGVGRLMGLAGFDAVHREAATELVAVGGEDPPASVWDWPRRADAYLQGTVASLEHRRRALPEGLRFVGPLLAPSDGAVPDWWADLDGDRPVVHVTQGTAANDDPAALLLPAVHALGATGALVVVATGGPPVETLGPLPGHVRAAPFLPYDRLMPRIDLLVTNGGWGGVQHALRAGAPVLVAGRSEDKAEVAARVAASGAGLALARPTAARIARAAGRLLGEPGFRQRAAEIAEEMAAAPGAAAVREAVEAGRAGVSLRSGR